MSARDELWTDMAQFDHQVADGLWDGTHRDPDAPPWYRDLRALIHRARGPAEADELLDEPVVVDSMHRVRLGTSPGRPPRSRRVRTLGRVLAMKAAATTTMSLAGVAAAAAATTGVVAIAATTVVVPVVAHEIVPMINQHIAPVVRVEVAPSSSAPARSATQRTQAREPGAAPPLATLVEGRPPAPGADPSGDTAATAGAADVEPAGTVAADASATATATGNPATAPATSTATTSPSPDGSATSGELDQPAPEDQAVVTPGAGRAPVVPPSTTPPDRQGDAAHARPAQRRTPAAADGRNDGAPSPPLGDARGRVRPDHPG